DLDRAPDAVLPFDLRKIDWRAWAVGAFGAVARALTRLDADGGCTEWSDLALTAEEAKCLVQRRYWKDIDLLDERRFFGGFGREKKSSLSEIPGEQGHREAAFDGTSRAGEAEFASDQEILKARRIELTGRGENA